MRPTPRELEVKTQQIFQALEEPVAMFFANETPLIDVLKYIKQATTTPTFPGIPIYVDPDGLKTAGRSINSTIQLEKEGLPLKATLPLILKPLGLSFIVRDGFLLIDSRTTINELRVEEIERKLDRVLETLERLERAGK